MGIFDKITDLVGTIFPPAKVAKDIIKLIASGNKAKEQDLVGLEPAIQAAIMERDIARDKHAAEVMQTELETRATIIQAEMNQGDKFTKRARPTIVYTGLVMFFIELGVRVYLQLKVGTMPSETIVPGPMIAGWTVAVGVWSAGRSWEKVTARKNSNGGTKPSGLLKAILG